MRWTAIVGMTVMLGCGASSAPPPQATADDETCAGHRATDACMDDATFAQCRARESECPGEVLSLESCPLQFACP